MNSHVHDHDNNVEIKLGAPAFLPPLPKELLPPPPPPPSPPHDNRPGEHEREERGSGSGSGEHKDKNNKENKDKEKHEHHWHDWWGHGGKSSEEEEDHHKGDHKHDKHPPGPPPHKPGPPPPAHGFMQPPPPPPPDMSFQGYIGYGADGDMCMYRSMAQGKVSDECINAVHDLYVLRHQYWTEYNNEQQPPPHHHFGIFLFAFVFGVCLFAAIRRLKMRKRHQQIRSLLTSLHTNPELRAHVEKETGVAVPAPLPDNASPCGSMVNYTDTNTANSCYLSDFCRTFVKGLLLTIFLLAGALLINFISLIVTMHIVDWMGRDAPEDPETGEPRTVSPGFTLFILFSVITIQLLGIAAMVKACQRRRQLMRQEQRRSSLLTPLNTSAEDMENNNTGAEGGAGYAYSPASTPPLSPSPRDRMRQWWSKAVNAVHGWRQQQQQQQRVHEGYAVLPDDTTHGQEMVSMHGYPGASSATSRNIVTTTQPTHSSSHSCVAPPVVLAAQQINGETVLVPITARPVNAVSLV